MKEVGKVGKIAQTQSFVVRQGAVARRRKQGNFGGKPSFVARLNRSTEARKTGGDSGTEIQRILLFPLVKEGRSKDFRVVARSRIARWLL